MDFGLAPHTIVTVTVVALAAIAGTIVAMRQEQDLYRDQRRVSTEVGGMELPEIRRLLSQGMLSPTREFWQVMEEGLVAFRPRDRDEEVQRQRLLQQVRLHLL
ncbi:hypothetical protein [Actinomadura hibisca]|uniref:hypothetical protein n=1 Tax=Actinomadura hibisca TaxID=68565 RepID=UPI00083736FD|nr:hypothetical protein [Actinomadura hibisca]